MMERKEFEKLPEIANKLHTVEYSLKLNQYHAKMINSGPSVKFVQGAWYAWQAAKADFYEQLNVIRDAVLDAKYNSMSNDDDRIFSDIEDIQLALEAMIEAAEDK